VSFEDLDLNLLVVLDAVLAERSVARAARRLHVTPSAVSNGLAKLRSALGDPLLARSGRGVVPTPRALTLAPALGAALADLKAAVRGEDFDPAVTTRAFTLAVADLGQLTFAPRLAGLLARAMPRASLRVVGIDVLVASGGLGQGEVDVAVSKALKGPGLHATHLLTEELVFVAAERRGRRAWTAGDLSAARHVDVQLVRGTSAEALTSALSRAGITRDVALVTPTFMAGAAAVAASDWIAALPAELVRLTRPFLKLAPLRTTLPPIEMPLHLVWHERTDKDPAVTAFRALCLEAASAFGGARTSGRGGRGGRDPGGSSARGRRASTRA
jgi:DNA-binding transcriptional LysR family regulator